MTLPEEREIFNSPSVYRGSTAKPGGVREMTLPLLVFMLLYNMLPQIDNVHFRVGVLVKTEEVYIQFLLWFL